MSRLRPRPALDRAVAFLRRLLSRTRDERDNRLPGIRGMAVRAGVAPVTMWQAVHVLGREGLLRTVAERQVLRVPEAEGASRYQDPVPPAPPALPRWRELQDEIAADLLALRFGLGALPSAKELCAAYGVGRLTLGRALRALVTKGRLVRDGRRFRLRRSRPRPPESRVVFLAEQPGGDVLTDLSPRSLELWRALEDACRDRRLRLVARSVQDHLADARRDPLPPFVVGYVVRNLDLAPPLARAVLTGLSRTGRPVALVDEVGLAGGAPWALRPSRVRTFAIAHSERAGREVGERLIELGHRRVAVLSPFGEGGWSGNRLRGVVHAFRAAGLDGALALATPALCDDDALRRAVARTRGYRALARATERLRVALDPGRTPDAARVPRGLAFRTFTSDAVAGQARPLFERALAEPGVSAWVGVNDAVALAALRFLRAARRRVPEDVSVVGFDNGVDALRAGLASYDFNVSALADALVEHVVGWRSRGGRDPAPVVEIPGTLVERASLDFPPPGP